MDEVVEQVRTGLGGDAGWIVPLVAGIGLAGLLLGIFSWLKCKEASRVADPTAPSSAEGPAEPKLTEAQFIELRQRFKTELEAELAAAGAVERDELTSRIATLEAQIANPDEALQKAQKRIADLDPSYRTLAKAHEFSHWAGQFEQAKVFGARLVEVAVQDGEVAVQDGDQPALAMAKNDFAMTLRATGEHEASEALYLEALEIDRAVLGEAHPDYAVHLNNYARLLKDQNRLEEAEKSLREALEIGRAALGKHHFQYANHLHNLGGVLALLERHAAAEELFREALRVDLRTIGARHPHHGIHVKSVARTRIAQGKNEEGRARMTQALGIFEAALPPEYPHLVDAREALATEGALPEATRARGAEA